MKLKRPAKKVAVGVYSVHLVGFFRAFNRSEESVFAEVSLNPPGKYNRPPAPHSVWDTTVNLMGFPNRAAKAQRERRWLQKREKDQTEYLLRERPPTFTGTKIAIWWAADPPMYSFSMCV